MVEYKQHNGYVELLIDDEFQGNFDTREEAHMEVNRIFGY